MKVLDVKTSINDYANSLAQFVPYNTPHSNKPFKPSPSLKSLKTLSEKSFISLPAVTSPIKPPFEHRSVYSQPYNHEQKATKSKGFITKYDDFKHSDISNKTPFQQTFDNRSHYISKTQSEKVGLLWSCDKPELPYNREVAISRFKSLELKFK